MGLHLGIDHIAVNTGLIDSLFDAEAAAIVRHARLDAREFIPVESRSIIRFQPDMVVATHA
jgi:hypothetical protein